MLVFGPTGRLEHWSSDSLYAGGRLVIHTVAAEGRSDDYRLLSPKLGSALHSSLPSPAGPPSRQKAARTGKPGTPETGLILLTWKSRVSNRRSMEICLSAPDPAKAGSRVRRTYVLPVKHSDRYLLRPGMFASSLQSRRFKMPTGVFQEQVGNPVNPGLALVYLKPGVIASSDSDRSSWYERINPMIGIPFDKLGRRWYLGANCLVGSGIDLNVGLQFEEMAELRQRDPVVSANGGYVVRTNKNWENAPFVGVTVDAVEFGRSIVSWFK